MSHRLRRLIPIPESSFLRKVSMLAGGAIVGQFLVVATSPLLTRLFTPEEFGLFAIFSALSGIIGVSVALCFEFAVPVLDDDVDAANMMMTVAFVSALSALFLAAGIWLVGDSFVHLVDTPSLRPWLWLLPPVVFIWGLGSALSYWSLRRGTYRINGLNRTLQLGSQAGGQVMLGVLGTGSAGLIVGYILSYVVRLGHYLKRLPADDRRLLAGAPRSGIWRNMRSNWRYPVFAAPSLFLLNVCQLTPAIFLAALYGPTIAGLYALGQRILGLPIRMLSETASQVFLGELRGLDDQSRHRQFMRTIMLFAILGTIGMLPVLLFAPPVVAVIFGESWREAGVIIQLLVPLYFARFIVQPVSQILHVLRRQDMHLLANTLNAVVLVLTFGMAYLLELEMRTTILIFSIGASATIFFQLLIAWNLVRKKARGHVLDQAA